MNYRKEIRKSQEKKTNKAAQKGKRKVEKLQNYLLPENPILENISNFYEETFIIYLQNLNSYLASLPYETQKEIASRLFKFLNDIEEILNLSKKKFKSGFSKAIKEEYCSKKGIIAYGFSPENLSLEDKQNLKKLFKESSKDSIEINEILFDRTYEENKKVLNKFYSLNKISYIPYTCRSLFCRYCAWSNTRKRFSTVFALLESLIKNNFKLSFITLTTPNHKLHETPKAIDELFKLLEKLYNFKLGERNLKRFHKKALIELGKYLANLHKKLAQKYKQKYPKNYLLLTNYDVWKKKKEHLKILNKTIRLVKRHLKLPDSYRRFGIIFESIWKFEIKKNNERNDFNSHWHGICLKPISRFFLKAITDYLGFGPIIDVRSVKGEKALVELTKYETKDIVSCSNVTFLEKVIINASLTHRKKFRIWLKLGKKQTLKSKLEAIKNKQSDNVRYIIPKNEQAYLDLKVKLSSIPTIYRVLRDKFPNKFEQVEIGKICYRIPEDKKLLNFFKTREIKLPVSVDKEGKFVTTGRALRFVEIVLKATGNYEKFVKALFLRDIKELKEVYKGNVLKFLKDKLSLKPQKIKLLEEEDAKIKKFLFIDLTNFEKYLKEKVLEIPSQVEENIISLPGPPPPLNKVLDSDIDIGF